MKKYQIIGIVIMFALLGFGAFLLGSGGRFGSSGGDSADRTLSASLATSELVKGHNRIVFGLAGEGNEQVRNADVDVVITRTDGPGERIDVRAKYIGGEFGDRGAYSARVNFSAPGQWQATLVVKAKGYETQEHIIDMPVLAGGETPAVGEPAPKSATPVATTEAERKKICTADPPCTMHDHSIADSIAAHRPAVILFAAPGACVSLLCGPQLGIVEKVKKEFGDRADFIHVEIELPGTDSPVLAVTEWGLPTEPWTFLVDSEGRIADKFEGPVTEEELRDSVKRMLEG